MVKKLLLPVLLACFLAVAPSAMAAISAEDSAAINSAETYLNQIRPDNAPDSPLGFNSAELKTQDNVVSLGQSVISTITGFLAAIAGTFAVFMIIRHSFGLITSNGDQKKIEGARNGILWSLLGLLGIIFSYLIIFTIVDSLFRIGQGTGL